jgi:fructose-bisphosphate aldolase class 1
VLALSGGYSRDEACELLAKEPSMIASFSRALLEGLADKQTDQQFNAQLERRSRRSSRPQSKSRQIDELACRFGHVAKHGVNGGRHK